MSGALTTASERVQRAMWDVIAAARIVKTVYSEIDTVPPVAQLSLYTMQDLTMAFDGLEAALAAESATIELFTGVHP